MGHQAARLLCGVSSFSMIAGGWLIQAAVGRGGGVGRRRKRSGLAVQAVVRTSARWAWIWWAVPSWTVAGVCSPMPEWRCSLL